MGKYIEMHYLCVEIMLLNIIYFKRLFCLCVLMSCLHVSMCTTCMTCRGQKRVLDPPELKLQMVVSCCVDAESSVRLSSALSSWAVSLTFLCMIYTSSHNINNACWYWYQNILWLDGKYWKWHSCALTENLWENELLWLLQFRSLHFL